MATWRIGRGATLQGSPRFPSTLNSPPFPLTRPEAREGACGGHTTDLLVSLIMARPRRAPGSWDSTDYIIAGLAVGFISSVAWACGAICAVAWGF